MKKILLSAFACVPNEGSELGNGWNWAIGLAEEGYEVHCLTRGVGKERIEGSVKPNNLIFHYVSLPFGMEKFYSLSMPTMYLHYLIWQWLAYKRGRYLHRIIGFDLAHHVTWGSLQLGSFLYKIPIPFIFGPVGGGQTSLQKFEKYFTSGWSAELKRDRVSKLLLRFNPACRAMLKKASSVWVSNPDTATIAKAQGVKNINYTLDAALEPSFFTEKFRPKRNSNTLKLLWVGRFLPRKGILLVLEVMEKLKSFPFITLTVVGDGAQREDFLKSIEEKKLEDTVLWQGLIPYEDVKGFYAQSDAFFFTSLRDSGGSQLIEAMAYGLPIVTINLHGQAIIVNDETGFRCQCDTPEQAVESLKEAILKLYNDPILLNKMSANAYAFARQQTWKNKIRTITSKSYS